MSIRAFYGFDGVATGVQGSSGDAAIAPQPGAGVSNSRNQPLTIKLYNPASPQYNAVGVTGLDRHKVGKVGQRRNALVIHRYSYAISFTSGATVNLFDKIEGKTNEPWKVVTGFTYVDFADQEPTVAYWLARVSRGENPSYFNLIQRRNDGKISVNGNAVPIERNKEYYFEIELWCDSVVPGRSSNPVSARVYLDGEVVGEWLGSFGSFAPTGTTPMGLEVGYVSHASNPIVMQMGVADVYVLDGTGEAPYNERLGPQQVEYKRPNAVVEGGWIPTGTSDALTALTDGLDSTGLKSPKGTTTGVLQVNLGLNSGSIVNGVLVYARGDRGPGAPRAITGSIEDSNGTALGQEKKTGFVPSLSDTILAEYLPSKTIDMAALIGNRLNNITVDFKVE
jgi:hypothetical protein